jgi:hypothetical protein
MFVLPNRKEFSDSIARLFLKYRHANIDPLDTEEDLCKRGGDTKTTELFEYQKIVRDYLLMETPYRGLLLYHGLGSGKTCSAIAVAESLVSTRRVYVMLPASLESNFRGEILKCGDPMYVLDQHWEQRDIKSEDDTKQANSFGISKKYLDENAKFFVTIPGKTANFDSLTKSTQDLIRKQVEDIIQQRFNFIRYNGLTSQNIDKVLEQSFDDSVIIIDEAHNLISSVLNEREIKMKLYEKMYHAKNTKIVALSGTPVINRPNEISFLMNLLRGPIERVVIPTKNTIVWDEQAMTTFFRAIKDVDTIEYNSIKKVVMLTRNPPYFESQYNSKGERIAVKYSKEFTQLPVKEWVESWKSKFEPKFASIDENYRTEELECLPTEFEEFMKTFVDGLTIRNPILFSKRIQGLVSYFRSADERLVPKRIEEDKTLVHVPMSAYQFSKYLETRWVEIQQEQRRSRNPNLNADFGSFRMTSRLACNFALPSEFTLEETDKKLILERLKADPERYLTLTALEKYSPKMLEMLKNLKASVGKYGEYNNQFVYSQYVSLEGIGIFTAILDNNGFQPYKLVKKGPGMWEESMDMKQDVPAYALYTGGGDDEDRELMRQIFNRDYSSSFPQGLKNSIKDHKLCVFLGTRAAAEGITLADVRDVHVMEPYWNPALIEQVIGRAIRICSHRKLPIPQRTVRVRIYLSTFTKEQTTTNEGPNVVPIRRNDIVLKRYDTEEPRETFLSSDEYLYEVAYEKGRIIKNLSLLLKQSAIDCEIHRPLHKRETPVIQCMRFDTNVSHEDLAYNPNIKSDEKDSLYLKNLYRKSRKLQLVKVKNILVVIDPITNEVFDAPAFQDSNRLIRVGVYNKPNEIQFFNAVRS